MQSEGRGPAGDYRAGSHLNVDYNIMQFFMSMTGSVGFTASLNHHGSLDDVILVCKPQQSSWLDKMDI